MSISCEALASSSSLADGTDVPLSSLSNENRLILDDTWFKHIIASGRVYQQKNFVSETQVQSLLDDIEQLMSENAMIPSGLSNTNKGNDQDFGQNDRSVSPVPWWPTSLMGSLSNKHCLSKTSRDYNTQKDKVCIDSGDRVLQIDATLQSVSDKLQTLRRQVSLVLNRPTMADPSLAHECYYSRSVPGAYLKRHMDERHEEMKGPRGWMLSSRRSISWLIYLSDENWDADSNGGSLRSYPQVNFADIAKPGIMESGSHYGNLQVGWLLNRDIEKGDMISPASLPVYLDSWYKTQNIITGEVEPHCILYIVKGDDSGVEYISKPWINDSLQIATSDFLKVQAEILKDRSIIDSENSKDTCLFLRDYGNSFRLIEDRESWSKGHNPAGSFVEDISPQRGSLVMFDSVSVPHEVMLVKKGIRSAIAGWFHEETQQFPDDFFHDVS